MTAYNSTIEAELPGWDDKPLKVRMKRPSLLSMAACGQIPNELMAAAQKLFSEGYDAAMPIDQLGRMLLCIAREALAEPTLDELEQQGCCLTDMQLAAIYNFTQSGVRALLPFRTGDNAAQSAGDD